MNCESIHRFCPIAHFSGSGDPHEFAPSTGFTGPPGPPGGPPGPGGPHPMPYGHSMPGGAKKAASSIIVN